MSVVLFLFFDDYKLKTKANETGKKQTENLPNSLLIDIRIDVGREGGRT